MKADPKHDGLFFGLIAIFAKHGLLELDRCSERVNGAIELDEAAVTGKPDHSSAAAYGGRTEPLVQMCQKPRDGAALIPAHQSRRSNRVCKEDGHQFALLTGHGNSPRVAAADGSAPGTAKQSKRRRRGVWRCRARGIPGGYWPCE